MSNDSTIDVLSITSQDGCSPYIDGVTAIYGYVPSLTLGVVFCTLFTLSLVAHIVQLIWKRTWWCSVFALGCVGKFKLSRSQWRGLGYYYWDPCAENEHDIISWTYRVGRPDLVIPLSLCIHPISDADLDSDHRWAMLIFISWALLHTS